jgi:hypothetical protein
MFLQGTTQQLLLWQAYTVVITLDILPMSTCDSYPPAWDYVSGRFLILEFQIPPSFCPRVVTSWWGQQELEAAWVTHRGKAQPHNQQEQMPDPNIVSGSFCCCLQCMLLCGSGNRTSLTCTKIHPLLYACVCIISFGWVWMDCASLWVSCHESPWYSVRIPCARERFIRVVSSLPVNLGPGEWWQVLCAKSLLSSQD